MKSEFGWFFILWCLNSSSTNARSRLRTQMNYAVKYIRQCEGKENLPARVSEFKIEKRNKNDFLSGDIVFDEDFEKGFNLDVTMKKCNDVTNNSTCTIFLNNLATPDLCLLLKYPLPYYAHFVRSVKPPPLCPIKKGTYSTRDFKITDTLSTFLPKTKNPAYFLGTLKGHKDKRQIICINLLMYGKFDG